MEGNASFFIVFWIIDFWECYLSQYSFSSLVHVSCPKLFVSIYLIITTIGIKNFWNPSFDASNIVDFWFKMMSLVQFLWNGIVLVIVHLLFQTMMSNIFLLGLHLFFYFLCIFSSAPLCFNLKYPGSPIMKDDILAITSVDKFVRSIFSTIIMI